MDTEIARMLKYRNTEETRQYVQEKMKLAYSNDFPSFMAQMLEEKHMKKNEIAQLTGLSTDYLYKILNGSKKTQERDYIIAICFALQLNYAQVQHALACAGMPTLISADIRSNIIIQAFEEKKNMDQANDWLEKAGFPLIKTSPDMPSAEIIMIDDPNFGMEGKYFIEKKHTYKLASMKTGAEHSGNAPVDYDYWGIICVQDEMKNKYYLNAYFGLDFTVFIVVDEAQCKAAGIKRPASNLIDLTKLEDAGMKPLEEYDEMSQTITSDFYPWFMKLDYETDKKVVETLSMLDDTRNYGIRMGGGIVHGKITYFLEYFNSHEPERKEYYQIVQTDDTYRYSISHESYYLRMELDDFYPLYYPSAKQEEYFINVDDTSKLYGKELVHRFRFNSLRLTMHEYFNGRVFSEFIPDIVDEKIEVYSEQSVFYLQHNNFDEACKVSIQVADLLEGKEKTANTFGQLILAYWKVAFLYGQMGQEDNADEFYQKILNCKDDLYCYLETDREETLRLAVPSYAKALLHMTQFKQEAGDDESVKSFCEEIISLLEETCNDADNAATLFHAYLKVSYVIDGIDPEKALEYTDKAIYCVQKYRLDGVPHCKRNVVTLYNNHAWVLWNRLSSMNAIIYYGRAIELLERYLLEGDEEALPRADLIKSMQHEAEALNEIYAAKDMKYEQSMLKIKMLQYEIDLK